MYSTLDLCSIYYIRCRLPEAILRVFKLSKKHFKKKTKNEDSTLYM